MLDVQESASESELTSREFHGDPRRAKECWLKAWLDTYEVPAASLSLFARYTLIPACRGVTISKIPEAN
jgi:hypothetical protein